MDFDKAVTFRQQFMLVLRLSMPAILAQIISIAMQYIDAAMLGKIGARASASVGLVSTSTWLLGGLCSAAAAGFSVQSAQYIGAKDSRSARQIFKHALLASMLFSILLASIGAATDYSLPVWLGAEEAIRGDARKYFLIYSLSIPFLQLNCISGGMLQSTGNMRVPSILNGCMCVLDVIFNLFFIFPSFGVGRISFTGLGMGVTGAALGTALAEAVTACAMFFAASVCNKDMRLTGSEKLEYNKKYLERAVKISVPMAFEHMAMCGAMVMTTRIIAPLGTVAIAANSFAITAESLCYMPGYGIASAASVLVGQSIGAKRIDLARRFGRMSSVMGVAIMSIIGAVMYFLAPYVFAILTVDPQVRELGTKVLRIEVFAEPLYAASIVASGALRGAGDTLIPSLMNFFSIWLVRIGLALILTPVLGLAGAWIAMCIELCVRGILLVTRLLFANRIYES
ncbi:MAG: MATE family efflux transporter [Oscillospiraceae bacterium]|nr:MATE family efflux transporter [Oscillospiraceae bacterium]